MIKDKIIAVVQWIDSFLDFVGRLFKK